MYRSNEALCPTCHPFPIFLHVAKPEFGWVCCGWEAGKGNAFDKWKIMCQEKKQSSHLCLTCFLSVMSVLEARIKSAFVIEIFGQPWMIRHYLFSGLIFSRACVGSVFGLSVGKIKCELAWKCCSKQWGKSKHRPDQGISCRVMFGLKRGIV